MLYYLTFIVMGYILGSILFAPLFGKLITKKDIIRETKDQNRVRRMHLCKAACCVEY